MNVGAARFKVKAALPVLGHDGVWFGRLAAVAGTGGCWAAGASLVPADDAEPRDRPT